MNLGDNLTNNMNFAVLFVRYEENKLGILLYGVPISIPRNLL